MMPSRRNFTIALIGVVTAGINYLYLACGSSSETDEAKPKTASGGNCKSNGTSVTVGTNHGHGVPTISAGDVTTGAQQTYIVTVGSSDHTHSVMITAANFAALQQNNGIQVQSNSGGLTPHTHTITINCV